MGRKTLPGEPSHTGTAETGTDSAELRTADSAACSEPRVRAHEGPALVLTTHFVPPVLRQGTCHLMKQLWPKGRAARGDLLLRESGEHRRGSAGAGGSRPSRQLWCEESWGLRNGSRRDRSLTFFPQPSLKVLASSQAPLDKQQRNYAKPVARKLSRASFFFQFCFPSMPFYATF